MGGKLALFLTKGMSIRIWRDLGLTQRECLLYELLYEKGWETYFISYGEADDANYLPETASKIQVLTKPHGMTSHQYLCRIPWLYRDVLQSVDVIKSHQIFGALGAVWTKFIFRKPYIARCGYLPSVFAVGERKPRRERLLTWTEEFAAFQMAEAICVPCQQEIQYLHKRYRINSDRAYACPNWIDTSVFAPQTELSKHPRRVCFIGRFEPQKQPLVLLEALKGLENIELLMIGGGSLKSEIEAKIKAYGIQATILDRVSNSSLPAHLNSSALYVLPTLYEGGSPKTLLEAMSCELPVVSTNAFGVNEAFEDGIHGYKCAPHDVRAIREAIQALLAHSEQAHIMGVRGRQYVIRHYAIERALERELGLLEYLKGERSGRA